METFYTADTHFYHRKIMEYCPDRGNYANSEEHDEGVIEIWNKIVGPKDQIWVLGDFAFGSKKGAREVIGRLNGYLNFVPGNHDERWIRSLSKEGIKKATFHDYQVLRRVEGGSKVVMSHFPYETWAGNNKKTWHFHGHTHKKSPFVYMRRDVGWDVFGGPATFEEVTNYSPHKQEGKELAFRHQ